MNTLEWGLNKEKLIDKEKVIIHPSKCKKVGNSKTVFSPSLSLSKNICVS